MESEHTVTPKPIHKRTVTFDTRLIVFIALLFLVTAGGFIGGVQYQKNKTGSAAVAARGGLNAANGQMGAPNGQTMNGSFGTVTAVSETSISVKDQRADTTKTYAITSATTITKDSVTIAYSAVTVGDSVMVATSSSTSTDATTITINPSMGGRQGGFGGQMQSTTVN